MTTNFTTQGLRWAFDSLIMRAEVAAVMDEMLATIEHWKLANDSEVYRLRWQEKKEEAARLVALNAALLQAQEAQSRERQRLSLAAKELRDRFVEQLILAAKGVQSKEKLANKAQEYSRLAERVPRLEKELQKVQRQLKEAQKHLGGSSGSANNTGGNASGKQAVSNGYHQEGAAAAKEVKSQTSPQHTLFTTFMNLEETLLLRVLSYLNTPDVLSSAEVCRPFYDRIGHIFGDDKPSSLPPAATAEAAAPTSTGPQPPPFQQQSQSAAASRASTPTSFFKSYSSLLGGAGGGGVGGGSSWSSLIASSPLTSSSSSTSNAGPSFIPPPSKASAAAKSVLGDVPITEKIATSMASKLSGAELKSIIAMTEKTKKLEAILLQFQAENEDVRERLQGAESVKEFMMAKLKETEVALKKAMDGASHVARQRSSDQEVISFLDGRVQDLEMDLHQTATRLAEVSDQARKDKQMHQEQIGVLKDMLAFEKHQAEEQEVQFRQQKRILAREVKTLRQEVLVRQKERDAYREELRALRNSSMLLAASSSRR